MQGCGNIERFVIIIGTFYCDEARTRIGPDRLQEIRKSDAAKAPDHVPTFNADMPSVLSDLGKRLNLSERVISWSLHCSRDCKCPPIEVNLWIVHVVVVDGEPVKRREFRVNKCRCQMAGTKELCRSPIAESQSGPEEWFLQFRDGKRAQRYDRRQLQQFTPAYAVKLPGVDTGLHGICSLAEPDSARV